MLKEVFSAAAIVVTFALFVPYIRLILKGAIKPHVFSWIIWGVGTLTVCFAQLAGGAGIGAWPIGISGVITFGVALLAYLNRGDTVITRTDVAFFVLALTAFPIWAATSNPLWAVCLLTFADLAGFAPTVRRAYTRPHQESAGFFTMAAVRNGLVVLALERYSLTTALFPAAVGLACGVLSVMIAARRRIAEPEPAGGRP